MGSVTKAENILDPLSDGNEAAFLWIQGNRAHGHNGAGDLLHVETL